MAARALLEREAEGGMSGRSRTESSERGVSIHRPPPPGPPGMYFFFWLSCMGWIRGRPGVRFRGDVIGGAGAATADIVHALGERMRRASAAALG